MNGADLLISTMAGAIVVISGGCYALFFALGRLRESRRFGLLSSLAYLVLLISVFVLAESLSFERLWYLIVGVMLLGYLVAPRAIWYLTEATHSDSGGVS